MVKEIKSSLEDGDIRELSVLTYLTNDNSTCIKQKSAFWIIRKTW